MFVTDAERVARHDTRMPSRKPFYPPIFLGEWLKSLRVSGTELAKKMDRDKFYISRLVTGKQRPDREEREVIGAALGILGDKLLERPPVKDSSTSMSQTGLSHVREEAMTDDAMEQDAKYILNTYNVDKFRRKLAELQAKERAPRPRSRQRTG